MRKKNFKVTAREDGKEYWISRACAVVGIVYAQGENGEIQFLVSKRGPGSPEKHRGEWNFVCGYLDFGETKKEAVVREVWEELGLLVGIGSVSRFCEIDDPERDELQNIVTRYLVKADLKDLLTALESGKINTDTESRGGEPKEVEEIKLITLDEVDKYPWAFGHDLVMKEVVEYLKTGNKPRYCED